MYRWVGLVAVAPVAGMIVGLLLPIPDMMLGALLAVFAGFFLYIGAAELLPEAHRNDRSRYACPFFLGPNYDVVVERVPSCVGPDNPPRYEPTTYGAFTEHLLTLNFAHRQAGGSGEYVG